MEHKDTQLKISLPTGPAHPEHGQLQLSLEDLAMQPVGFEQLAFKKFALVQFNPIIGNVPANLEKMIKDVIEAKNAGADIVIFNEMSPLGYTLGDYLLYDDLVIESKRQIIEALAPHSHGITIVTGFVDSDPNKKNEDGSIRKFNSALILHDGDVVGSRNKTALPNYRYFDDKRYFSEGDSIEAIRIKVGAKEESIGLLVCEEIWDENYAQKVANQMKQDGARLLICINASPFDIDKGEERQAVIAKHSRETGLPIIYVNACGIGDNGKNIIIFDGSSRVYDGCGREIYQAPVFESGVFIFDPTNNTVRVTPSESRAETAFKALTYALKEYAQVTGFKKAIIPLSGGADSALCAAIAKEALGAENVIAYNLPSQFNTDTTKNIAQVVAENLGVKYVVVPIQSIVDETARVFQEHAHPISNKVALENLHARARALLMMLESNDEGYLLISCGNKTEIALAYCTLYGDMAGGLSLIGALPKRLPGKDPDVYKLLEYYNSKHDNRIFPKDLFTIKPSAELSEGQFDPFDYWVVSPLVEEIIVNRKSPRQLIEAFKRHELNDPRFWGPDHEGKTVYDKYSIGDLSDAAYRAADFVKETKRLARLIGSSVYKRVQSAPIVSIGRSDFGHDRREPILGKWFLN